MDGFESVHIQTSETSIFVRWAGSGAPLLLLHLFFAVVEDIARNPT